MYKNNDYIYDAALALEQLTGFPVSLESQRKEYDAIMHIDGYQFYVEAKNEIRKENEAALINLMTSSDEGSSNKIIVAKYIAIETAKKLKTYYINYLDASGNCYIKSNSLQIYVSGQKVQRKQKTNQAKAFQETGIRLLFHLLSDPKNLQLSYRELAELAEISTGSVSNIITELESQHFILKTKKKRILKSKPELLERWIMAYHDVLRPRLVKKQMRFIKPDNLLDWKSIKLNNLACWGAEPGAAILTKHLTPEQFTLYTNDQWQNIGASIGLVPDNNGKVEILQQFWKNEEKQKNENEALIAPPLLIYADLMGSGYGRNIETAKIILENELQHIK
ncbi:hypothetical protein FACS1894179_08800 [Bacteroidia bacterium]|uniref:Type IV toxin-antitoxin system AbiEi family antitoxin n=1 Tax=Dysgonomonas termitidis TaxID=1516126 RepID=A0ABV9L4B5_9BACT|nr:hypothetical protein FACS1894169_06720 [Bacteroidia bacterium]GHV41155.1 hypothetical protein FACS1894179_08800 [Bacteroidia bacterium]